MKRHWQAVGFVATVAATIGVCALTYTGKPEMTAAWVFADGDRVYAATLIQRSFTRGRGVATSRFELTTTDLQTGEQLAKRELTDRETSTWYRPQRRVGYRIWALGSRDGVELVDLRTAAAVLTEAALGSQLPELDGGKFSVRRDSAITKYSPPTRGLPITLPDGRKAWVNMTPSVSFQPVPTDAWRPGYFCGPDGGAKPSCERRECIAFKSVAGSTGMVLHTARLWGKGRATPSVAGEESGAEAPADGTQPLLRPGLLRLHDTECALELEGSVFILHDSSAIKRRTTLLSRVARDGRRLWTRPVSELVGDAEEREEALEPFEAVVLGGELMVLLSERRNKRSLRIAVLDPASGTLRRAYPVVDRD